MIETPLIYCDETTAILVSKAIVAQNNNAMALNRPDRWWVEYSKNHSMVRLKSNMTATPGMLSVTFIAAIGRLVQRADIESLAFYSEQGETLFWAAPEGKLAWKYRQNMAERQQLNGRLRD